MPDHDVYYFTRWALEEVTNTSVGIEFWIGEPYEEGSTRLGWWNEIYLKKARSCNCRITRSKAIR